MMDLPGQLTYRTEHTRPHVKSGPAGPVAHSPRDRAEKERENSGSMPLRLTTGFPSERNPVTRRPILSPIGFIQKKLVAHTVPRKKDGAKQIYLAKCNRCGPAPAGRSTFGSASARSILKRS